MNVDDSLARLRTGLDRDAELARAATELPSRTLNYPAKKPPWEPERWRLDRYGSVETVNGATDPIIDSDYGGGGVRSKAVAEHIARQDPHGTLLRVEVIRRVQEIVEKRVREADIRDQVDRDGEEILSILASIYPEPTEEAS